MFDEYTYTDRPTCTCPQFKVGVRRQVALTYYFSVISYTVANLDAKQTCTELIATTLPEFDLSMGSKLLDTALLLDTVIILLDTIIGYSYYMPMDTAKSVE